MSSYSIISLNPATMNKIKLLLLLAVATLCSSKVFHVTPTLPAPSPCPSPCHTLNEYAHNISLLEGHTNVTLIFLRGEHMLKNDLFLSEIQELSMHSQGEWPCNEPENDVTVHFQLAKIHLNNATHVKICDITMTSNDSRAFQFEILIVGLTKEVTLLFVTFQMVRLIVLEASSINVQHCNGNWSYLDIAANTITINDTNLTGGLPDQNSFSDIAQYPGISVYSTVTLRLLNSQITKCIIGAEIFLAPNSSLDIMNTYFEQNDYALQIFPLPPFEIRISSTTFKDNSIGIYTLSYNLGQGDVFMVNISYTNILSCSYGMVLVNTPNILVTDSICINNTAGIASLGSQLHTQDTLFCANEYGMAIFDTELTVISTNFSSNTVSGLALSVSQNISIQDSHFQENKGTALIAHQSSLELNGRTVIRDNMGNRGGGLALYHSTVTFCQGSDTQFINNTALEFGGAIYMVSLPNIPPDFLIAIEEFQDSELAYIQEQILLRRNCFYIQEKNSIVYFKDNNASLGGLSVYGPTLYTVDCSMRSFKFDNNKSNTSQVTSDPSRVFFCDLDTPTCEHTDLNTIVKVEEVYPGETLTVSVTLAGYNFGIVAGSVYTNVVDQDYRDVIDPSQHVQTSTLTCSQLNYKIYSRQPENQSSHVILVLTAQDRLRFGERDIERSIRNIDSTACNNSSPPCTAQLTTPIFINITLKACPLGFTLNEECECDQIISGIRHDDGSLVNCDQIGYITRRGSVWVGVDQRQDNPETYYWYRFCPRDYCNTSEVSVNLSNPDEQCELNRGGLLCGGCENGSSLLLGSNKCKFDCDNRELSLMIVFAALGILLVVLISTLDLTVANGTVNGLIFYANIVWINKAILLSSNDLSKYPIPIAWINLDFGIEVCFSEGLDQLTKTGLQFVFPVYIWCLAGLIIVICHYSTRATKLFGNNSVAVLATLFLLSYGKLFRNITDIFIPAYINGSNNTEKTVWALDGNIEYIDWRHIILVIVALIFLLLFVLPFTLLILLVPFLKIKSDNRLLSWINRLTPFFETFYGPYKHKKRYQVWTGFLLVSRMIMLLAISATSSNDPYTNLLLIITVSAILLVYVCMVGQVYKKFYVSLLEVSYLLNLNILSGALLLYQTSPRVNRQDNENNIPHSDLVSIISMGVVMLQLGTILISHFVKRIMSFRRVCLKREAQQEMVAMEDKGPTTQVVELEAEPDNFYDSSRYRDSIIAAY